MSSQILSETSKDMVKMHEPNIRKQVKRLALSNKKLLLKLELYAVAFLSNAGMISDLIMIVSGSKRFSPTRS